MNMKEFENLMSLPYQESIPKFVEIFVKDFDLEKEMGSVLAAAEALKKETTKLSLGEQAEKAINFAISRQIFGISLAVLGKRVGVLDEQTIGKFMQMSAAGSINDTFEMALPILIAVDLLEDKRK